MDFVSQMTNFVFKIMIIMQTARAVRHRGGLQRHGVVRICTKMKILQQKMKILMIENEDSSLEK